MDELTKNYKFIKPGYEEFSDVEIINQTIDMIDDAIAGVGVPEEIYNRLTGLESGKADKNHASATTEYGAASTTQYGHTKLYSGIDSDSESLAAKPTFGREVAFFGVLLRPTMRKYRPVPQAR